MIACPACGYLNIEGVDNCEKCDQALTELSNPRPSTQLERSVMRDKVRQLASHKPLTVSPKTPAVKVMQTMVAEKVGSVVIVNERKQPIGIFTERDALLRISELVELDRERAIEEFMTLSPETLNADDPIAFAFHRMDVGGYRHIPIVEHGQLVGVVSVRDILRYCSQSVLAPEDT